MRAGARRELQALEALSAWEARAGFATAELSGATVPRLRAACLAYPVISAALAAAATGASRATARRNLQAFEARGLLRETTG